MLENPEFDLFGGVYQLPPESRLLDRLSLRLSPGQKERFFEYASDKGVTPSEVVREYVVSIVGD